MSRQQLSDSGKTRREMLAAIRAQLAASAPHDLVHKQHEAHHANATVREPVVHVDTERAGFPAGAAEHFRASLEAIGGNCSLVPDYSAAAISVGQILARTRAQLVGVSRSPRVQKVMEQVRTNAAVLIDAGAPELFNCDVGITSAQWGIAETGTLVLESDQERHRLTSLVPTAHIALIPARQIRFTLGEILQEINASGVDQMSRAVTFITGPSRTSDIELTLAIGVHGPAALYVIVVEDALHE